MSCIQLVLMLSPCNVISFSVYTPSTNIVPSDDQSKPSKLRWSNRLAGYFYWDHIL